MPREKEDEPIMNFSSITTFTSPQIISLGVSISVFLFVLFVAIIKDEAQKRSVGKRSKNEWMFTKWEEKVYDTFIKERPETILKSLGVDIAKYKKECEIARDYYPNFKKLATRKILGLFLMLLALIMFIFSGMSGMLVSFAIGVGGFYLYDSDTRRVAKDAQAKKNQLAAELPRFLDMLQTALYIDLPVDDAITITAKHLKNFLISEELLASMAETQIGATSWQRALENIAQKYEVDTFSDFSMYLITGYEKGLSIYDVVKRQTVDVQKTTLINAEANASKLNTSILFPIAFYKLFPLILLVGVPLILQMSESFTLF